jgi:hypothetical protein
MIESPAVVYQHEFDIVAKQAWCFWNRDPASPSYGSFDRYYWGWKKRDFKDATYQYAVILAIKYARSRGIEQQLEPFLEAFVNFCVAIQHPNGSFDQSYPHERTPSTVYVILSALLYVRECPCLTNEKVKRKLDRVIQRGVRFALKRDETYAQIANHIAQYAYELYNYHDLCDDTQARERADRYMERLLSLYQPEEGWFQEYDGPDPGYQTRTLRYLTKCALLLNQPELWEVVRKAADFLEAVLMPDGSLHPMLGSRSTALLFPSSFEILAARYESYQGLAARVRKAWEHGRVPLPSTLDFDNAIRLADDAKDAADAYMAASGNRPAYKNIKDSPVTEDSRFSTDINPDRLVLDINFPNAGISILRYKQYIVYVGYRLGGVVIIYGRENGQWRLLYEDSGYLVRSHNLKTVWLSRIPGSGKIIEALPNRLVIRADFYRSLHDEMTPIRLTLLRIMNMTILRFQWPGDLFRKMIVRHLMSGRKKAPLSLHREIIVQEDEIRISDCILGLGGQATSSPPGHLFRCRRLTGIHMASSRYFQDQELEAIPLAWMQEISQSKDGNIRHEITINISPGGKREK